MRRVIFSKANSKPTIIRINTALGDGLNRIRLPLYNSDNRIAKIDMGDGNTIVPGINQLTTYNYTASGIYDIKIYPKPNMKVMIWMENNSANDILKYVKMLEWGNYELGGSSLVINNLSSFRGCQNLDFSDVQGKPTLLANCGNIFSGVKTSIINGWTSWDWSNVKIINGLISGNNLFNQPFPVFGNLENSNGSVLLNCSIFNTALPIFNAVGVTSLVNFASGTSSYTGRLDFITSSALTDMRNITANSNAVALTISDCSGITSGNGGESQFGWGSKLTEIILIGYALDLDIRLCTLMTTTAYLNLITSLADLTGKTSKTMTVKNHAAFTTACSTAAAAKNWTVIKV